MLIDNTKTLFKCCVGWKFVIPSQPAMFQLKSHFFPYWYRFFQLYHIFFRGGGYDVPIKKAGFMFLCLYDGTILCYKLFWMTLTKKKSTIIFVTPKLGEISVWSTRCKVIIYDIFIKNKQIGNRIRVSFHISSHWFD